jgi:iron complex outermembrane receptor protein
MRHGCENFRIAVGGENVFNSYPDRNTRALGLPNQSLYVATDTTINAAKYVDDSPFGYDGGFGYLRGLDEVLVPSPGYHAGFPAISSR